MARYTGAKCRLCRREGEKLFLKGARCFSEKCAVTKRNQFPGQHIRLRRRTSDYGRHLREKQKVKRIYGLLENQFRNYYEKAAKVKGVTGQLFLQMLERRLDSVSYVSGLISSRAEARQKILHGKVLVNGEPITIPSYQVKEGDVISVPTVESKPKPEEEVPEWLVWNSGKKAYKINRLPERDDIDDGINEQLIVEFYSR